MNSGDSAFPIFRLLETPGVGGVRVWAAIDVAAHKQIQLADLLARPTELGSILKEAQLRALQDSEAKAHETWSKLRQDGVLMISIFDDEYPGSLRSLLGKQAPLLLFIKGNGSLLNRPSLGFCGSRKASEKGISVARECSDVVSKEGINVVSGYAAGVDMIAHRTALEMGSTTTVVLAEGIFHFRIKRDLKDVWDWERVAVISEYMPHATWNVQNAMRRNATICALCRAMVLIEARENGGSIAAGRTCMKLGLPLFAPVYEGMPEWARGNQILINDGARSFYKSKSTNLPNLRRVLEEVQSHSQTVTPSFSNVALHLKPLFKHA
jgi:DNA processing protein